MNLLYIQINEIQVNIDEITCIFQNVIFTSKKYQKCYFTSVEDLGKAGTNKMVSNCFDQIPRIGNL